MPWLKALFAWLFRSQKEKSPGVEQFTTDLQELKLDEKRFDARLDMYDQRVEQTRKCLEAAQADKVPAHKLDKLNHDYREAKADFQSYRRQVDNIRTNISALANLARIVEEKVRTGLKIEVAQYEAQARALYETIQKQKRDLDSIRAADEVLAEVQNYTDLEETPEAMPFKQELSELPSKKDQEIDLE